jgi:DUF4097 and DUF4098 domain-containing protein YvlB
MRRIKRTCRVTVLVLTAMSFVSFAFGYEHERTINRTFPLNPEGVLRLETVRGSIYLSTHAGHEVTIKATLMADEKSELDKADIKFETAAGLAAVSAMDSMAQLKVDIAYDVKVPEKLASVYIITLNGKIDCRGEYGQIDLKAFNGGIDFNGNFTGCRLTSGNGDIDVDMRNILSGNITGETGNGSILLRLRPESQFTIEGSTRTGSIRSDFETTITNEFMETGIKGTVGEGTYQVRLKAVNGDIRLRKK